ncbi:MAG: ArsB/NhaD family transporter [Candidatus Cloacimonetes bacterium]|jgi:Na+/H+ antiporter NhaD/arsenite permease-like protein|nr:ArsB/NhaD family transporter [Candidatus Cloacimonadota bacterium]MCB5286375.1 ArsB/NhaD family transporter [Candidatus Cloacimonadota bacterium]MCK9184368.1 ArsB/NhaD family transporter [Candidatus Cloacimonadota bacterium]MDY0228697.1 ArsB/NhaD family transporter [Candidatus Cloacimonadaceae bacterium]
MALMLLALLIFGVTYLLIITEWINKMLAAMLGGFAIILTGIVTQDIAFRAIDWNVIFFLIGMMLVISVMRQTGVFMYLAIKIAKKAKGRPLPIMILMYLLTTFISAFMGSVTTIMILVPIVLLVASELKITPVPFITTMIIASNAGGAATMIGDPPNILIGSATDYNFLDFIYNLTPPVLIITLTSVGLIWLLYRGKMRVSNENRARLMGYNDKNLIKNKALLKISLIVLGLMLAAFMLQGVIKIETATIAMTAGLFLLIVSDRHKVEHTLANDIDWATIFFFMGLFMIVESLVETGFINHIATGVMDLTHGEPKTTSMVILWLSGIFSAVIDNVPFVAAMIPVLERLGVLINNPDAMHPIWWSMALGACLGGNGTMIGASANIVAIGIANRNGFHVSFKEYTKIGALFALNAIVVSTFYILIRYY